MRNVAGVYCLVGWPTLWEAAWHRWLIRAVQSNWRLQSSHARLISKNHNNPKNITNKYWHLISAKLMLLFWKVYNVLFYNILFYSKDRVTFFLRIQGHKQIVRYKKNNPNHSLKQVFLLTKSYQALMQWILLNSYYSKNSYACFTSDMSSTPKCTSNVSSMLFSGNSGAPEVWLQPKPHRTPV